MLIIIGFKVTSNTKLFISVDRKQKVHQLMTHKTPPTRRAHIAIKRMLGIMTMNTIVGICYLRTDLAETRRAYVEIKQQNLYKVSTENTRSTSSVDTQNTHTRRAYMENAGHTAAKIIYRRAIIGLPYQKLQQTVRLI